MAMLAKMKNTESQTWNVSIFFLTNQKFTLTLNIHYMKKDTMHLDVQTRIDFFI